MQKAKGESIKEDVSGETTVLYEEKQNEMFKTYGNEDIEIAWPRLEEEETIPWPSEMKKKEGT